MTGRSHLCQVLNDEKWATQRSGDKHLRERDWTLSLGKGESEHGRFEGRKVTVTEPQGRGWCHLLRQGHLGKEQERERESVCVCVCECVLEHYIARNTVSTQGILAVLIL